MQIPSVQERLREHFPVVRHVLWTSSAMPPRSWARHARSFATHSPLQHLLPKPQSVSDVQPLHWFARQSWPSEQSPAVQHEPVVQSPPQHTEPSPHWLELAHG